MWVPILALGMSLQAIADSRWNEIKQQAQGQTVYFNAWGVILQPITICAGLRQK